MRSRSALWLLLCVALSWRSAVRGAAQPAGPPGRQAPPGRAARCSRRHRVGQRDLLGLVQPVDMGRRTEFTIELRTYTMTATSLTQEIIDGGVVQVYMRFAGLNCIVQSPFMVPSPAYSFSFRACAGSIKVVYYDTVRRRHLPIIIPPTNQSRYVLIPGEAGCS